MSLKTDFIIFLPRLTYLPVFCTSINDCYRPIQKCWFYIWSQRLFYATVLSSHHLLSLGHICFSPFSSLRSLSWFSLFLICSVRTALIKHYPFQVILYLIIEEIFQKKKKGAGDLIKSLHLKLNDFYSSCSNGKLADIIHGLSHVCILTI